MMPTAVAGCALKTVTPHLDAATNQPISAANVLVLEADHIEQPYTADGYWGPGNFAYSTPLIGEGRVFLFRDGEYIEGVWKRNDRSQPLRYTDLDGNDLLFKPGNTWVNLVPRWTNGFELTFMLDAPDHGDDQRAARGESADGASRGLYLARRGSGEYPGDGGRAQRQRRLGAATRTGRIDGVGSGGGADAQRRPDDAALVAVKL